MDPAAYISVGAAVRFQREHNWGAVRAACHQLASETRARLDEVTGLEPVCPDSTTWYSQMFTARLPQSIPDTIRDELWTNHRIEVPLPAYHDQPLVRVSVQAYNTPAHMDHLIEAIKSYL